MKQKSYMSISEFSRLTGIKRANLIFYDKIGLLAPECRGENEYRYYTRRQLGSAYLIVALRELGIGLKEIQQYADGRTPQRMVALFASQAQHIQSEIDRLTQMREIMKLYTDMAEDSFENETSDIILRRQEREPIFAGPVLPPDCPEDEGMLTFYDSVTKQGMELGYPLGTIVSEPTFESNGAVPILRYYFKVTRRQNSYKPAGLYAVAYGRCGYNQVIGIYDRLLQYIKEHDLTICGDAYEEYPINEISLENEQEYLIKVEIMVK